MATPKPIQTKRGDTEVLVTLNMNLTGATLAAAVKAEDNTIQSVTATMVDAPTGKVALATSGLIARKYKLEVQVTTTDNKVFTFPDTGYATLIVNDDIVA